MSGIVFGGIAPHGFSIIKEIAGPDIFSFKGVRDGMEEFNNRITSYDIDTIIILTPHGLKVSGHNAIYLTDKCSGTLRQYGESVSLDYFCDKSLATEILNSAKSKNINLVGINIGAMSGEYSSLPMDWGVLIPLWFTRLKSKPQIVVISPSRDVSYNELLSLGKIINAEAIKSGKNIALIASADQGHCHDINGPYGYAIESEIIDKEIIEIIKTNQLLKLTEIDSELISKGKPDSIWQLLILYGALDNDFNVNFITYQVPTYFGMLVATYERN